MPHVKYQLFVAVLPCRNRLGNLLVIQMRLKRSGSIQKLRSAVFWELSGALVPLKTRVRKFILPLHFGILPKRSIPCRGDLVWL